MKQGEYNTVVMIEPGKGMSILQAQIATMGKVVVIDVGLAHRGLLSLIRDGRKVNSRFVPVGKTEPYYRQYDKRQ
ncbi:hypothetical protein [Aquitalea palustris]|uniref:hypothetical protein n=1 Tax=Aquitalea palustris TaxID=2480983 RepID=UPI001CF0B6AA|nr:hypothetical protein [Aquitalea palustris]